MTTKKIGTISRIEPTLPVVQDTMLNDAQDKKKENSMKFLNVIVGAVPIPHSSNVATVRKGDTLKACDRSNREAVLQHAASMAMEAGRRSEASAALVRQTFPRLNQEPILPFHRNRTLTPLTNPSTTKISPKAATTHNGKQCQKAQPKHKGTKKPTKKQNNGKSTNQIAKKKRSNIKGKRSSWNLFFSDFASANPSILGGELATEAARRYKQLSKEEKAHYEELAEADRIRVLVQTGDPRNKHSSLKILPASADSHIQYSNVKKLLPFLKEQQSKVSKLVPHLNRPQPDAPCIDKATPFCNNGNLENLLWSQRIEKKSHVLDTICACLDMKSLMNLELCSSILRNMDLIGQEKARRKLEMNHPRKSKQVKNDPSPPIEAPNKGNHDKIPPYLDQAKLLGSLGALPKASGLFESSSRIPGTGNSPPPFTSPSSQQGCTQHAAFLPSCFYTRPPVDPLCASVPIDCFDFQDAGYVCSNMTAGCGNERQGKDHILAQPSKKDSSSTLHQANPRDIAKGLLHEFLGRYGLFWPFQYWLLHVLAAQKSDVNPRSRNQSAALNNHTLSINKYYDDPKHPFRKFFHPCSAKYLSVMENLADKLAHNVEVLEEFRSMAHDVAVNYAFFRDGLHYVLQNADAKAFQPLLGIPDFHSVQESEAIYRGN